MKKITILLLCFITITSCGKKETQIKIPFISSSNKAITEGYFIAENNKITKIEFDHITYKSELIVKEFSIKLYHKNKLLKELVKEEKHTNEREPEYVEIYSLKNYLKNKTFTYNLNHLKLTKNQTNDFYIEIDIIDRYDNEIHDTLILMTE